MIPLVSIIIPVYGVERYIEKCIRSVLEQTSITRMLNNPHIPVFIVRGLQYNPFNNINTRVLGSIIYNHHFQI